MSHYDCSDCGVYMCFGDCDPVEDARLAKVANHEYKIKEANRLLKEELDRRVGITEARDFLKEEGLYDPDQYDVLFN